MSIYVNFDHLIDYLRKVRKNRGVNISPYMDNALLNVQQMLELDVYDPILFDYVEVGNCDGCAWKGYRFICPVIFEDGTMLTQNSMWNWYELENYGTYSEENDDYFVPEGWWENRQFTPDDIYNNPVDCTVTHWMPLPGPPMSARMDGDAE